MNPKYDMRIAELEEENKRTKEKESHFQQKIKELMSDNERLLRGLPVSYHQDL